jgi:KipI family sensor histidine kinase inhibitor
MSEAAGRAGDERVLRGRELRIRPLGDRAALVELGDFASDGSFRPSPPDLSTSELTLGLARDVDVMLGSIARDVVPAYRSVLVEYDPDRIAFPELEQAVHRCLPLGDAPAVAVQRVVTLPVSYGGESGPDLADVAVHTGLTPAEVIAAHSEGTDYRVAFLGFSPGYAYLHGLPPRLATPRLASPRSRVPPGSVAIGGQQTAVYPQATPGGWRLIGRTAVPLFQVERKPAALLEPGDQVVFRAVELAEHEEITRQVRSGRYQPEVVLTAPDEVARFRSAERLVSRGSSQGHFDVVSSGLLTTVQDGGRPGRGAQGVSPGGAQDRSAYLAANRLVGNPPEAAVLEMTLVGPALRPSRAITVALTGARLGAMVDGRAAPHWEPFEVPAGGTLTFSPALAEPAGLRGYLAVAGGIDVPLVLGSRSTDLTAGFGGLDGGALRAGSRLSIGRLPVERRLRNVVVGPRPRGGESETTLRVIAGPHDDLLAPDDLPRFLAEPYTVSSQSSHMGVRLSGAPLRVLGASDLVSEAMVTGTVQVPADGQPIILLAGRGTVGGYAKIAGVIDADLDLAAQLRPGTTVQFKSVSLAEAAAAGRCYRTALGWLEGRLGAQFATGDPGESPVARAAAGLLDMARSALSDAAVNSSVAGASAAERDAPPREGGGELGASRVVPVHSIDAPVLGYFHRGAVPGRMPIATVGDELVAGVTVATVTVLGEPYDVVTSEPVEILGYLVEDGQPVEYGQPLIRVRPMSAAAGDRTA